MELYPVSTSVNRPRNDFKGLIKRMGNSPQEALDDVEGRH
jgi:hypothetical protein